MWVLEVSLFKNYVFFDGSRTSGAKSIDTDVLFLWSILWSNIVFHSLIPKPLQRRVQDVAM